MKIIFNNPPNIKLINKFFSPKKGVVYTYGDTIYNPRGFLLDKPLVDHEQVHMEQQKSMGVDRWWNRYCRDAKFRGSQEVSAYQAQYKAGRKIIKDRNQLSRWLDVLAKELSGELYGNIMTFSQAKEAIEFSEPITFKIK